MAWCFWFGPAPFWCPEKLHLCQDGRVLPMSYPHANVERGLPTQAGSAQKNNNFQWCLARICYFFVGDGSENQQKSSWTPCIEVNCGEAHIWNGVGWKPTKWWHGELMLPFPIQSWRLTHHSDDGKIWTPLKLPWRINRWVPICSSDCLAAPRQDLWWLWRDGAQHLCWGCPMKGVKIWRMKLRGAYVYIYICVIILNIYIYIHTK